MREKYTWEVATTDGRRYKQYRFGRELPIGSVLTPLEGKPHWFSTEGIRSFSLVGRGERHTLTFDGQGSFFFFRRVRQELIEGGKARLVSMEFHFGNNATGEQVLQ